MRDCGDCTACCLLTTVRELSKDDGVLCPHCTTEIGCGIYEDRPLSCREFKCFWLAEGWPTHLRPDKCNVMFEALPGVTTVLALPVVSSETFDTDVYRVIQKMVNKGRAVIFQRECFLPAGKTKEDVLQDIQKVLRINNGCSNI